MGFSLSDIREMLDLYDVGDHRETQRLVTLDRCRNRIESLHRQRDDIDATLAELHDFIATIDPASSAPASSSPASSGKE